MYLAYTYLVKNKITNQFYYGSRYRNIKLKRTPEQDLWIYYYTSSKKVKKLIEIYGKESFEYEIIHKDSEFINVYWFEQDRIKEHIKNTMCLNEHYIDSTTTINKFSRAGSTQSLETKSLLSKVRTGSKSSIETKMKQSEAGKARKNSAETREKISKSNKGRKGSMAGKHHSEETKRKMSVSNKGKIMPPITEERRTQISAQFTGSKQSNDHKNKRLQSRQENGFYKDRESTIKKQSIAAKNRPKYKCHCGKECSLTNYKRWHGNNCKITVGNGQLN